MPHSTAALRAAIHGALKSDGPLVAMLGGAKIYDEPPREAALPYVTLGEAVVSDRSTSTESGDEHALTLHVWSRQGGHREASQNFRPLTPPIGLKPIAANRSLKQRGGIYGRLRRQRSQRVTYCSFAGAATCRRSIARSSPRPIG